jgi:hypothetical protein
MELKKREYATHKEYFYEKMKMYIAKFILDTFEIDFKIQTEDNNTFVIIDDKQVLLSDENVSDREFATSLINILELPENIQENLQKDIFNDKYKCTKLKWFYQTAVFNITIHFKQSNSVAINYLNTHYDNSVIVEYMIHFDYGLHIPITNVIVPSSVQNSIMSNTIHDCYLLNNLYINSAWIDYLLKNLIVDKLLTMASIFLCNDDLVGDINNDIIKILFNVYLQYYSVNFNDTKKKNDKYIYLNDEHDIFNLIN